MSGTGGSASGGSGGAPPLLDLEFAECGGRIRLVGRRCRWPFVVGTVFVDPAAGESVGGGPARGPRAGTLVVQYAGGGLHPGDCHRQVVTVGAGVHARVLGQGAVLVHGVAGRSGAQEHSVLRVRRGGFLLHRPEPRVLLPGARLEQSLTLHVEPGATSLTVDATVLHPSCLDGTAEVALSTTVGVVVGDGDVPSVVDRTAVTGSAASLPAMLLRWPAFATVHAVAPGRDGWQDLPPFPPGAGVAEGAAAGAVTVLPAGAGVCVRLCARDGLALRRAVAEALAWSSRLLDRCGATATGAAAGAPAPEPVG